MMISLRPVPMLLVLLLLPGIAAADDRADADAVAAKGLVAMHDADADPHRGVDAAILFSQALTLYEKLGDDDEIAEMQANIFWCKKRMNLDDLQSYLAHKGEAASTAFAAAKEVMDTAVPVSEAGSYLARAQKFQAEHADDHFEAAILFSEIIERFPDSDAAKTAEPVFVKEQAAYLAQVSQDRVKEHQQLQDAINNLRSTRFMQPPAVSGGSTAVPPTADQERALTAIKTSYKAGYSGHRENQKLKLALKLFAECESNRDDAAYYYTMLQESERLAIEASDFELMLQGVEKQGATFQGFDAPARKRELLGKVRSEPVAAAILTLLENPRDPKANLVAGKSFCFTAGRWDVGLPMLADGDDADLHAVAEMELSGPSTPAEQLMIAERWHSLGKHGYAADRMAMWSRADHWYQLCLPNLGGINRDAAQKTDEEIQDALPLGKVDWNRLTPKQWEKVKGKLLVIESKVDRSNGVVVLNDELRIRVVPYPDDRDKMQFQVGNPGPRQGPGILSGNGQLWIFPTTARRGGADTGELRLKLVEVDPDE